MIEKLKIKKNKDGVLVFDIDSYCVLFCFSKNFQTENTHTHTHIPSQQPENLVRRLEIIDCEEDPKQSRLLYYELDNATYLNDVKTQQDIYQRTKEVGRWW